MRSRPHRGAPFWGLSLMPVCNRCSYKGASSSFRRSPKGGHLCRDKQGCDHDKKIRDKGWEPGPRGLSSLLRF